MREYDRSRITEYKTPFLCVTYQNRQKDQAINREVNTHLNKRSTESNRYTDSVILTLLSASKHCGVDVYKEMFPEVSQICVERKA